MDKNVLEIGYFGHPVGHASLESFLATKPGRVRYHGIDLPDDQMHSVEEALVFLLTGEDLGLDLAGEILNAESAYRMLQPENVFLYRMDGRHLYFRDEVFDEVHMHYVVSQPDVSYLAAQAMTKEAYRVLIPGGHLIVTGEDTPTIARKVSALGQTKEMIQGAGFSRFRDESEVSQASVFSRDVLHRVSLHDEDEPYFLLVAQK